MIITVLCPKCNHKMKYQPKNEPIGKVKKCVYCGCSFTVRRDRIID